MSGVIVVGIIVVGLLLAGFAYVSMREDTGRDPLQERLMQYGERELPSSLEEIEMSLSFRDRILVPVLEWLGEITTKFTPQKQLETARVKIERAGMTTDPSVFFATRLILAVVFFVGGVAAFLVFQVLGQDLLTNVAATLGLTWLGFYFPMSSVNSRIAKRQKSVIQALPDALDLLVICVEAGLGFDMAMGKVYEKWDNELSLAFGRVLREIQLGKLRREALRDMAERFDVADVSSFTAAIIQADQLGVSMAKILRVQSDQMRVKRRQRAQEKAQQAPVKMMIPMVFLIFPSIWIVLLGPAVLKIKDAMGL